MSFRTSLEYRLRVARRRNERYRADPDYRLARINAERARKGLEPHPSLDRVKSRIEAR
jgi:hypothetical protein